MDYCRLWAAPRAERPRLLVSVPLTQSGAVFLDEESKALQLIRLVFAAGLVGEELNLSGWPSYTQLAETLDLEPKHRIVGLAAPTDTPPAGSIGYYSDRQEHVAVVTLSKSGRRLFIEFASDGVISTNVPGHLFGER